MDASREGKEAGGASATPRTPPAEIAVGPEGLLDSLLHRIEGASSEVLVMAYELEHAAITDALAAAQARGARVRVLVDGRLPGNAPAIASLTAGGVEVRRAPARFPHAHSKVLVCDGREAMIMSANFNEYSMQTERNFLAIDRDPRDLADLGRIFEGDWAGDPDVAVAPDTRLVLSPVNARARVEDLVHAARERLDLAVMSLMDPAVLEAVVARARRGVAVRVLLADPEWIERNAATARDLASRGIPVRFLCDLELHAKLVLGDRRALVGSHNLSSTSLDLNREVSLLVEEPAALELAARTFEDDWSRGEPPPA